MLRGRFALRRTITQFSSKPIGRFASSKTGNTNLQIGKRGEEEEWERWKTKFAGKFVIQSGTATTISKRSAEETMQNVELESLEEEMRLSQIVQVEQGRTLTVEEVESLQLRSKFEDLSCHTVEGANGAGMGMRLASKVEGLLRDNLEDIEMDMREIATAQGTISRKEFSSILQNGGESGTALGPLLSGKEVDGLLDFAVNIAGDGGEKIYIQKLTKSLRPQQSTRRMKKTKLFFDDGNVSLSLSMPEDPSKLLDDALDELELLGGNSDEYIPYWVQLWPSAFVLANEVASGRIPSRRKRILEISAGLGLPGLMAARKGAERVCLTEYDQKALRVIEDNARENSLEVETTEFDWFRPRRSEILIDVDEWDVFLFADVMYEKRFIEPVASVIATLLRQNKGSQAVFTDPQRSSFDAFIVELRSLGLEVRRELRMINICKAEPNKQLESEHHAISILFITLPQDSN